MPATAGRVVHIAHCPRCPWLSDDLPNRAAAQDVAGVHDDNHHDGQPTATVLAAIACQQPLPLLLPPTGLPLTA